MSFTVYLSGEIHTDWRDEIRRGAHERGLDVSFTSAVTDHEASDAAGDSLGPDSTGYWRDHKSSLVNSIRTRNLIEKADLVVVRFGDKYKQWNAAFDAGYAAALGKPIITLHDAELRHPLKEVDGAALAWAQEPSQVVRLLKYVIEGTL
jgi:YtoQ family protein